MAGATANIRHRIVIRERRVVRIKMYLLAPFETTTIFIRTPPLATQNSCESAMCSRFGIQPQGPRIESYIVRVSVELPGRIHRRDSLLIPKSPSVQRN